LTDETIPDSFFRPKKGTGQSALFVCTYKSQFAVFEILGGHTSPLKDFYRRVQQNLNPGVNQVRARIRRQILLSFVLGLIVGIIFWTLSFERFAPSLGWDAGAISYLLLIWRDIWRLNSVETQAIATSEDASTLVDDTILILASVVSLMTVALVLSHPGTPEVGEQVLRTFLGIISVVLAWAVLHTVFTLRYARLFYEHPVGGVDFNTSDLPRYSDFAYIAFGVGMAFQVADTNLKTWQFRRAVLRHALLSFIFATTILAVTINLVASLNG